MSTRGDLTKIDLGDDLLSEVRDTSAPQFKPNEIYETAKILMYEGFLEEAKKHLRQILIHDSHHLPARKLLDEIHSQELKEIFRLEQKHKPKSFLPVENEIKETTQYKEYLNAESDEVIQNLEKDFNFNLNEEKSALDLFRTAEALDEFREKLKKDIKDLKEIEKIDIGTAFFQMNLIPVAHDIFEGIYHRSKREGDSYLENIALCLLLEIYLKTEKHKDGILLTNEITSNPEKMSETSIDLIYLIARCFEENNQKKEANRYYQIVYEKDSRYRDINERFQL